MVETLQSILDSVGAVVSSAFGWVSTAGDAIMAEPILFIFAVAVPLVGLGAALFKRLASNL